AGGIGEMIDTPDNVSDAHVVVIHNDREIIGWIAVRAQDDEVIKVLVGDHHTALGVVVDDGFAFLGGFEADDGLHACWGFLGVAVAPSAIIADGALFGLGLF